MYSLFALGFVAGMVLALWGTTLLVVRASARGGMAADPAARATVVRPSWKQALVMLTSGAVLGASSCYGFLETVGRKNNNWYGPLATGFYLGCLLALGALAMILVRLLRMLFGRPVSNPPR